MKCHNEECEYYDSDWEHNCREIGLISFKKCNRFKGSPDTRPDGLNIHQPESEFETITISLHTKESARDFFTIMQKVESHRNNCDDVIRLTPTQAKILVKICDFKMSGL